MTNAAIIDQLKDVIRPYTQNEVGLNQLSEQTDFLKDLQINSANLVDIALDVEDLFGIEIDNESMQQMFTVGAAVQIIQDKLKAL